MSSKLRSSLPALSPNLQISFSERLDTLRSEYLSEALLCAVADCDLAQLNDELNSLVPAEQLRRIASFGLRGEVFFPVPLLLRQNPRLLGYYRLFLGFSQKEFYGKGPFGRFRRLEESGLVPAAIEDQVRPLCISLIASAVELVTALNRPSQALLHELQLLTLGAQLRGSKLNQLGQHATRSVFDLLKSIVSPSARNLTDRSIRLRNAAGRTVQIEFASDPDIKITEVLKSTERPLVSIEIKGGEDRSNIHNRLGEAEKSHQKAMEHGFREFWTILGASVDSEKARLESPTTKHFFQLKQILDSTTREHAEFRELVCSIVGIRVRRA